MRMACLSEKEMENVVAGRCAAFGPARKVTAYLDRKGMLKRPFALVDRETPEPAARLAATLGRITLDKATAILLAAGNVQPACVSVSLGQTWRAEAGSYTRA